MLFFIHPLLNRAGVATCDQNPQHRVIDFRLEEWKGKRLFARWSIGNNHIVAGVCLLWLLQHTRNRCCCIDCSQPGDRAAPLRR